MFGLNQRATTLVSFAISVAFWWMMTGSVNVALGILILIFVHEMGHYFAAKQIGVTVSTPVFSPFGAAVLMGPTATAKEEAYVGIAGPFLGTVASVICFALGLWMGVGELFRIAQWGLMLNLFNLIPLSPLDGGRISMAVDRRLWVLGAPMFLYVMFVMFGGASTFNLMIGVMIGMQAYGDIQMRAEVARSNPGYFEVGAKARIVTVAAWLALGGFLAWTVFQPSGLMSLLVSLGL